MSKSTPAVKELTDDQQKYISKLKVKRDLAVFNSFCIALHKHSIQSRRRILVATAIIMGLQEP